MQLCVVHSAEDLVVTKRNKAVVRTGLSIAIPSGTYARIAPRSGLAVKHFVDTGAGVVDQDYRGEVGVVLFNHGDEDFKGVLLAFTCSIHTASAPVTKCNCSQTDHMSITRQALL